MVDVSNMTCTCREWQDRCMPCRHAICALEFYGRNPEDYMGWLYTIKTYRECYEGSIHPVILDELTPDGVTTPWPLDLKKKGRPKSKRFRRVTAASKAKREARLQKTQAEAEAVVNSTIPERIAAEHVRVERQRAASPSESSSPERSSLPDVTELFARRVTFAPPFQEVNVRQP